MNAVFVFLEQFVHGFVGLQRANLLNLDFVEVGYTEAWDVYLSTGSSERSTKIFNDISGWVVFGGCNDVDSWISKLLVKYKLSKGWTGLFFRA